MKQTSVSFATFGGRSHGSKTKIYQFSMKGFCGSDEVTVQLPEVPVMCLPLGKPKVDSALLEEFDHLDLAFDYKDSSPHVTIDILIGQDLYWSFILGDVVTAHFVAPAQFVAGDKLYLRWQHISSPPCTI